MSECTVERLGAIVSSVLEPVTGRTLGELDALRELRQEGEALIVRIALGFPCVGTQAALIAAIGAALAAAGCNGAGLKVSIESVISAAPTQSAPIAGVKNIIAVASGKGGVGKSTTSVNVALALAAEGARVGILDADIYGPSQPHLLGVGATRPAVTKVGDKQMMVPVPALGLQSISMGYLITEDTPVMWRGPMVSGALQQLLTQTAWDNLDYLVIDMPPGTGDIQITLAQRVPVTGALIVTTPQDLALLDAKKAVEMFNKVKVPVLGVVENMSSHVCSQCGHVEAIFGTGGGETMADAYQAPFLGALPLNLSIRQDADAGLPSVAKAADAPISLIYREVARKLAANLWLQTRAAQAPVNIAFSDD